MQLVKWIILPKQLYLLKLDCVCIVIRNASETSWFNAYHAVGGFSRRQFDDIVSFPFFQGNRINFIHVICERDNLHELSNPIFCENKKKNQIVAFLSFMPSMLRTIAKCNNWKHMLTDGTRIRFCACRQVTVEFHTSPCMCIISNKKEWSV